MTVRILVADDNVQALGLVTAILQAAGYDVTSCDGGIRAVDAAAASHFDLIMLDGMMPDVDGFEACELIRKLPGHAHTPVVFLTGITDDGAFEDAIEAGADEVIAKPIRRSSLLLRVRSLLRVGQLIGAQESFQAELSSISETLVSLVSPLDRIRARSATLGSHSELPEALRGDVLDLQAAESELVELTKHLRKVIDGMAVVAPAPDGV